MQPNAKEPSIPFDDMWGSDRYWIPLLLAKRNFVGRTDFGCENDVFALQRWWFGVPSERVSEDINRVEALEDNDTDC